MSSREAELAEVKAEIAKLKADCDSLEQGRSPQE